MNLTRRDWSKGWNPSQDRLNGDPQALLRMDNLHLDETGVISLVRGVEKINTIEFSGDVKNLYSVYFFNTKWRYVHLSDGSVIRSKGSFENDGVNTHTVLTGGDSGKCGFGFTLGTVLICSGDQRKREYVDPDAGTIRTYDITPPTPTGAPTITSVNRPATDITDNSWTAETGTISAGADYVDISTDASSFIGAARLTLSDPAVNKVSESDRYLESDKFNLRVRIADTSKLIKVRVEFILDNETEPQNYFWKEWLNFDDTPFMQGTDAWTHLSAHRWEFERVGDDGQYSWSTVVAIRVSIVGTDVLNNNRISELRWTGGSEGPLNGSYEYMQVNVDNTGSYQAKSLRSPITDVVNIIQGYAIIDPNTDTLDDSINEIWIFRRSASYAEQVDSVSKTVPKLDTWYRVAVSKVTNGVAEQVEDKTSDLDALTLGITYDESLQSVADYVDDILDIVGNFNGRTVYMTFKEILFSYVNDPGLIDYRYTLQLAGTSADKNLWIRKASTGRMYVATTSEIYMITGSLSPLPDGTIDITVTPLGLDTKPLSAQVDEDKGILYTITSDGVYAISGTSVVNISPQLNLLFQGHIRYEFSPINTLPGDQTYYPIAIGKSKLWIGVPLADGTRWILVYDFVKQYWYPWYLHVLSLHMETDGTLIGGFGGSGDRYVRILDISSGGSIDGVSGQRFRFETIADDNGQPRNRKDAFTLKITADSGGVPVNVAIAKNGSSQYYLIDTVAFDGSEKMITIAETIGPAKSYALKIYADNVFTFKLYNFTIEYDPRPEQLTYLRIQSTNLGTTSRKRFVNFAFSIDTLGETCEFFPIVDGQIIYPSSTFSFTYRGTHIHYFDHEVIGHDIGGIICGFFEFYGVNLDEIVSEKLPVPVKYLVIPANDYGTPNRKRHSSYKFQIDTRGKNVQFIPVLDGVQKEGSIVNTTGKRTHEHFFTEDTIAIDIGGILYSLEDTPFEFYGVIVPQNIEVLPPRLKEFRIPENNYGVAAKKRVRTMPMVINTNGNNVTFTPIVDGQQLTPSTLNTSHKQTVYHYFETDVFGTDFSGELVGSEPFEFYGLEKPEGIEVLPVPKKFDQIGPIRFDRIAKILRMRLRCISGTSSIPFKILSETEATLPSMDGASGVYTGEFSTQINVDDVWEVVIPKTVYGTVFRIELGPTSEPFHRYDLELLVNISGGKAQPKWVRYQ